VTTELVAWYTTQLDQDEQHAQDFDGASWHVEYCGPYDTGAFHERFDPAWVLRDIAAKRRILTEHQHYHNPYTPEEIACGTCHTDRHDTHYAIGNWCTTVRVLAETCAHRDGYNEEWRP
jgi:hypothetical protein